MGEWMADGHVKDGLIYIEHMYKNPYNLYFYSGSSHEINSHETNSLIINSFLISPMRSTLFG